MPNDELQTIKSVLDAAGIAAEPLQHPDAFRVTLRGEDEGEATQAYAHLFRDERVFMFRIVFPWRIPSDRLADATTFLTRANDGLFIGNFELDLDEGEVKFKTYVDYRDSELEGVQVRNAILGAMETYESYAPALLAVLREEASVEAALQSVEGNQD